MMAPEGAWSAVCAAHPADHRDRSRLKASPTQQARRCSESGCKLAPPRPCALAGRPSEPHKQPIAAAEWQRLPARPATLSRRRRTPAPLGAGTPQLNHERQGAHLRHLGHQAVGWQGDGLLVRQRRGVGCGRCTCCWAQHMVCCAAFAHMQRCAAATHPLSLPHPDVPVSQGGGSGHSLPAVAREGLRGKACAGALPP